MRYVTEANVPHFVGSSEFQGLDSHSMDPLAASAVLVAGVGIGVSSSWKSTRPETGAVTCHCECDSRPPPETSVGASWREPCLVAIIGVLIGSFVCFLFTSKTLVAYKPNSTPIGKESGKGKGKRGVFGSQVPLSLEL